MIAVAPGWPMMHWFWDLVNQSTKPLLQLLHWSQRQPFSQKYHQNLLHWYLHAQHLNTTHNHLNHSLNRWQRDLGHLKDPPLENYLSQDGPLIWQIFDALTIKNLKPSNIAALAAPRADHL